MLTSPLLFGGGSVARHGAGRWTRRPAGTSSSACR